MKKIALLLLVIISFSCSSIKNQEKDFYEGYFMYFADAAMFIDCKTQKKYPVVMESDYLKLEKKYLQTAKTSGAKIIVTFKGKIEERNKVEGKGRRDFIIVNKFLNIFPNKKCN